MNLSRLSQKELASLLLVEDRTVRNLKDEGVPCHGEGRGRYYVWAEVEPWWFQRRARLVANRRNLGGDIPDLLESEARKAAADAEMAEMKAATMRGGLLERDSVLKVWQKHIGTARAKLLQIGPKVSVRLVDGLSVAERQALIDDVVFQALDELARGVEAPE